MGIVVDADMVVDSIDKERVVDRKVGNIVEGHMEASF